MYGALPPLRVIGGVPANLSLRPIRRTARGTYPVLGFQHDELIPSAVGAVRKVVCELIPTPSARFRKSFLHFRGMMIRGIPAFGSVRPIHRAAHWAFPVLRSERDKFVLYDIYRLPKSAIRVRLL